MERSKEEKLEAYLALTSREVPALIEKIESSGRRIRKGFSLSQLSHYWHAKAIYAYYVKRNRYEFKQCCYLSAKIKLRSIDQDMGEHFDTYLTILSALMSDSPSVIDEAANVECEMLHKWRREYGCPQSLTYMYQLAIRRDDDQLAEMLASARKDRRRLARASESIHRFLDLLLQRDVHQIEEHVKSKQVAPLELKLCWHRGIPAKVEHELIPMELMPVEPLPKYDDYYEFLKPGWVPKRQTMTEKILGRLKSIVG
jgi:hypothetical protein